MGLLEEGDEVMSEGKKMEPAGADLALIGAAQKVEHYEMAGYITARNLAQQLQLPDLVQLLQLPWRRKRTQISCSTKSRAP